MINIVLLVVFALVGIGLGVGYNFLVVKKYPEDRRKGAYVLTVIIFLLTIVVLFSVISVKMYLDKVVPAKANEAVEKIQKEHSDVGFVRNGLNLTGLNSDVSKAKNAVADIKKVLPPHTEFGLTKGLYNFIVDVAIKELQKKLTAADDVEKAAASFADENNYLTVSSVINSLQKKAMKIINITLFVIAAIFVIIFLIHVIKSLLIAFKGNKTQA